MSNSDNNLTDSLTDLLIKQVTEGLSADEQAELDAIDPAIFGARRQSLELMVGGLSAALVQGLESFPEALKAGIERQAAEHFESYPPQPIASAEASVADLRAGRRSSTHFSRNPWPWLSAAACLVLAIVGWMRPSRMVMTPAPVTVQLNVPAARVTEPKVPTVPRTLNQERNALLGRGDSLKVNLSPSKDPAGAGVSADVVWDPLTNSGFLHIVGLKPNDPASKQYQAWVFDGLRDKRYPLDCALFNVPAETSEVIIPIQTTIPVRLAKAFAITVEQAGGVVVPDKVHVVALGTAG